MSVVQAVLLVFGFSELGSVPLRQYMPFANAAVWAWAILAAAKRMRCEVRILNVVDGSNERWIVVGSKMKVLGKPFELNQAKNDCKERRSK